MTAAHGGQTVVSGATEMLMRGQLPDGMELVDLGEHRLRDLGQPTRIFQLIRDGDREEFPPLRTLDSFPGNLPAQVSSFIGRKADVARVVESTRCVTGCDHHRGRRSRQDPLGITGRRRRAAALSRRRVAGRACVRSGRRRCCRGGRGGVPLHRSQRANRSRTPCSRCWLRSRCCLVLDNCEHVLGSVARLVSRIERQCPGIVVLATSREGLAIDGEQILALPPLEAGQAGRRHRDD